MAPHSLRTFHSGQSYVGHVATSAIWIGLSIFLYTTLQKDSKTHLLQTPCTLQPFFWGRAFLRVRCSAPIVNGAPPGRKETKKSEGRVGLSQRSTHIASPNVWKVTKHGQSLSTAGGQTIPQKPSHTKTGAKARDGW